MPAKRYPKMGPLSKTLIAALHQTASAIIPDAGPLEDNEELAELITDADRVAMFGGKEANAELNTLIDTYGYAQVKQAVASTCRYV